MKNLFVIGDVHGCYYTLLELLKYWEPETQQLVFVGDLIDRGNYTPEVVALARRLERENEAIVLMGNHEYEAYNTILKDDKNSSWFGSMGKVVQKQYKKSSSLKQLKDDAKWFKKRALFYENESVFISHAGHIGHDNYLKKSDFKNSVLWTRKPLQHLNKLQIHGHTPNKSGVVYKSSSHSLNIDTACAYGGSLSACIFNVSNNSYEIKEVAVLKKDITK